MGEVRRCEDECWGSWNNRNRLAARWLLPGSIPVMRGGLIHKKGVFRIFRGAGTARW